MAQEQEGKEVNLFSDKTPASPTTPSFTAPVSNTLDSNTDGKPIVKLTEADVNPQMANLIKEAEKSNAKLTERQMLDSLPDDAHKVVQFKDMSAKVKQILKDNGMDSQQVEKALKSLMEL